MQSSMRKSTHRAHKFFLIAPGYSNPTGTLALAKDGILRSPQRRFRRVGTGHFNICMT